MWHILKQIVRTGIVTEPAPGVDDSDHVIIERMHRDILDILGRIKAGAFSFDSAGNLVAPDGKLVQGYAVTGYDATSGDPTTTTQPATTLGDDKTGLQSINLDMNTTAAHAYFDAKYPTAGYGTTTPYPDLQSYEIGRDGTITGTYSNGDKLAIGKIAIANVQNPQGLEKSGDSEYVESPNSGAIEFGTAGQVTDYGQSGSLTTGALEMSNVDLAAEFTNLILAQRGFEASSKVITTSDQVLDDLMNMKR